MENVIIKENYIEEVSRKATPTEVCNKHLLERDDDPNQEINKALADFKKNEPKAYTCTQEIIQNFILDAFDEYGHLFKDSNCATGTMINTIYGKLREVAYKNFIREIRSYDSKTRAVAKIYFINQVDGENYVSHSIILVKSPHL